MGEELLGEKVRERNCRRGIVGEELDGRGIARERNCQVRFCGRGFAGEELLGEECR